jgi:hypothetical protein
MNVLNTAWRPEQGNWFGTGLLLLVPAVQELIFPCLDCVLQSLVFLFFSVVFPLKDSCTRIFFSTGPKC